MQAVRWPRPRVSVDDVVRIVTACAPILVALIAAFAALMVGVRV